MSVSYPWRFAKTDRTPDPSRRCKSCGNVKELIQFARRTRGMFGHSPHCLECTRKRDMQNYHRRMRDPEYREKLRVKSVQKRRENREKQRAVSVARNAAKTGKISAPEMCECCRKEKPVDKHHPDYARPLYVVWVCRSCHRHIHAGNISIIERP